MSEVNAVVVESQSVVDVKRVDEVSTNNNEPSMIEYAQAREEASKTGKSIQSVLNEKSASIETKETADSTQKAESTEEVVEDGQTTTASEPEETDNSKKGIEKKFSKLTSARDKALAEAQAKADEAAQARKEADEARAELERLKAEALAKVEPIVPKAEDDLRPVRTDFDDPDEYAAAIAQHAAREAIRKANEQAEIERARLQKEANEKAEAERQQAVNLQIAELHKTFNERVSKTKEDYADFDEKVTNNESLILNNNVFFTIEKSEQGPHILYKLANEPELVKELNGLNPYDAAIRIGELQAEVRQARKPQVTKAAEPIKMVGNRTNPEKKTLDEMSMDEYAQMREAEEKAAREKKRANR